MVKKNQLDIAVAAVRAVATPYVYREIITRLTRRTIYAIFSAIMASTLLLGSGLFAYLALQGIGKEQTGLLVSGVLLALGLFCVGFCIYSLRRLNPPSLPKKIIDAFLKGFDRR